MTALRYLQMSPVPTELGELASQLPDVLYQKNLQCLVAPLDLVLEMRNRSTPAISSDAGLAFFEAVQQCPSDRIIATPLTITRAAYAIDGQRQSETRRHATGRDPLVILVALVLLRIPVRMVLAVVSFLFSLTVISVFKLSQILGRNRKPVTGKTTTKNYQ